MCTLVAIAGLCPDVPLAVAANRDELYARAAAPPGVLATEPRIVGGRDLTKGGTWLGVTAQGFFVAVTNQRSWAAVEPGRRSRGELVLDSPAHGVAGGDDRRAREDRRASLRAVQPALR